MEWVPYIVALVIALLITTSAVLALRWAVRTGQFRDFEKGAETIFDEEEPIGKPMDNYPGRTPTGERLIPHR